MIDDRDRQDLWIVRAVYVGTVVVAVALTALLSQGCPVRVDPSTEEVCPGLPNCGRCASDINCAWCPSEGAARRCYARSEVADRCDVPTVEITEDCPERGLLGELPATTSGAP